MIRLTADQTINSFAPGLRPVVHVDPGSRLLLSTADCFDGQIRYPETRVSHIDLGRANPATGPVFINGAEPGDALVIDIHDLSPAGWGVTVAVPGMGLLGDSVATERSTIVEVGMETIRLGQLRLPTRPMLGVVGVAPASGDISTVRPGRHGGNLDCVLIAPGARVHLPVFQPGALFAAGDMHAAMADGEVSGTGIEVPGTALLELGLRKRVGLEWPWVEDAECCAVLTSAGTLEAACREAMAQMIDRLSAVLGLDFADAYVVAGSSVSLRICQVVNPEVTVRAQIAKSVLPRETSLL